MAICGDYGGRTKAGDWCRNAPGKNADGTPGPCYLVKTNPAHVPVPTTPETETPVPSIPSPVTIPADVAQQNAALVTVMLTKALAGDGRLALGILQARGFFPPLRVSDAS
jgi:hypothetical protein